MIPFQKIFTLLVRSFSKPMLEYFKKKHRLQHQGFMGRLFVALGRRSFAFEHWVNHSILRSQKARRKPELRDQQLLEKGIELLSEALLYSILLGLPLWELYQGALSSQRKEQKLQRRLASLDSKLEQVNKRMNALAVVLRSPKKKQISHTTLPNPTTNTQPPQKQDQEEQTLAQGLLEEIMDVVADELEEKFQDFQFQTLAGDDAQDTAEAGSPDGAEVETGSVEGDGGSGNPESWFSAGEQAVGGGEGLEGGES